MILSAYWVLPDPSLTGSSHGFLSVARSRKWAYIVRFVAI